MRKIEGKVIPFAPRPKDVSDMTADEILAHLKGRFNSKLIVIGFLDNDEKIELNTNTTLEKANWMLDRAKRLIHEDAD